MSLRVECCKEIKMASYLAYLNFIHLLVHKSYTLMNVQIHSKTHNDYRSDTPAWLTTAYGLLLQAEAAGLVRF